MTDQERQILFSLAKTAASTRAELDAMRILLRGVLNALVTNHGNIPALAAMLQELIDSDEAITLASPMTDEMLQRRSDWLRKLMPVLLQPHVRLP